MSTKQEKKSSTESPTTKKANDSWSNYTNVKNIEAEWDALASLNYGFYLQYAHDGIYQHGRHTRLVADKLQEVEEKHAQGEGSRTIITMPPRHSKSMTITETFPSWFIGKDPNRRVIEVSYGADLARKFGRRNMEKVRDKGQNIFEVNLDPDARKATDWNIENHRGGMISRGLGGAITGEGADLLIIDDPIKNRREAESETYRSFLWDEWESTLSTRLQPNAAVIVILTRWHEDDLVGRLLEKEGDKWDIINLPALAEDENDLLGRKPGEALWPENGYDEEWAAERKVSAGSRTWESLYQQNPRPAEGTIFKRHYWQYYDHAPAQFDEMLQSWDATFKETDNSDFVAGTVWGRKGADVYLLDLIRARMGIKETMAAITSMKAKWPNAHRILIEDKANGPAVIQLLKNKVPGLIPVTPEGGKEVRAMAAEPWVESQNVWLPKNAPFTGDFVEEAAAFPNGKHDDQVDSFTQAMARFQRPSGMFVGRA